MLRVREATRGLSSSMPRSANASRSLRLAACAGLGLMIGAGVTVLGVSMVQAEDEGSARLFHRQEAARRDTLRERQPAGVQASSYAPAASPGWGRRLFGQAPDGRLTQPRIILNPFADRTAAAQRYKAKRPAQPVVAGTSELGHADRDRTFCVRLCDGFHAPIGFVGARSDLKAHEALCQAANPGLPVKVFRLSAGRDAIHDAVSVDGRSSYGALPMAYSYQRKGDSSCRPAIAKADERRVSILRDFTLRPGDSVVLDGKVVTFTGGRWPYSARDFEDFRTSGELSKLARSEIDRKVGISRNEAQLASVRRSLRVREASLREASPAGDVLVLRGSVGPAVRSAAIRIVEIDPPAR